jgi:Gpi18-like mannosyltransferase
MSKTDSIRYLLAQIFIWWLALIIFAFFFRSLLPSIANNQFFLSNFALDVFFNSLTNWDGGHYIGIAQNGYLYFNQYAFFPFYPLLIKWLGNLFNNNYLLSSLLISNLALIFSIFLFNKLVSLDFDHQIRQRTLIYLLIFPSSFFLVAAYSESLFLLGVLASFYFVRLKKYLLASIFVFIASATRPIGILILLPILYEYLAHKEFQFKKIDINFFYLFTSSAGFLIYPIFLQFKFGNPLIFISSQSYWGRLPSQPANLIWESYLYLFSLKQFGSQNYALLAFNFGVVIFAFWLIIYSYKKIRPSYFIYSVLMLIVPLLTGSFSSMIRFILPVFPIFICLAMLGENYLFDFYYKFQSSILFAILFGLFVNGYWVA